MSRSTMFVVLVLAALLEAGGDAIVRTGLRAAGTGVRIVLLLSGGAVLLSYGVLVNAPAADFGRLLGIYVALFFVTAQVINACAFGVAPSAPVLSGGGLIIAGGLLMTVWR